MSLTGVRATIAAALSTVADVRGHEFRPATLKPGGAWPRLGPLNREAGTAFAATWFVTVVLPQDERAASEWIDAHWPPLFYALEPVGFVDSAEPVALVTTGGDVPAFQITLRAEE